MPCSSDGDPSPSTSSTPSTNPRTLLAARGLRPKKSLGQNFLMDGGTAARIARLAADEPGRRIVEVGAGTGALTAALVALDADVTAIDIDANLLAIVRERPDLAAVRTILADALTFDFADYAGEAPWRVAGNLPYNVATPLLVRLAQLDRPPDRIVAMIQRDVADRLTAAPGSASYGSLTVAIGLTMRVERAFTVAAAQFFPKPNVVSAVVVLHRREQPAAEVRDRARFEQVVRGAFAYRRKTLVNSLTLALGMPRERIVAALQSLELDADIRGETLDLRTFAALTDALAG
jgi:16S rRNA (adenine1518-N6/adenine1519-N6)-dimethyltransferase